MVRSSALVNRSLWCVALEGIMAVHNCSQLWCTTSFDLPTLDGKMTYNYKNEREALLREAVERSAQLQGDLYGEVFTDFVT